MTPPAATSVSDDEIAFARSLFDLEFYREQLGDETPDIADLFTHFMTEGWRRGYDPNPSLSVSCHLWKYPSLASTGLNPLIHWLRLSTRSATSSDESDTAENSRELLGSLEAEQGWVDGLFDSDFYSSLAGRLVPNGVDPFEHYQRVGWRLGLDPSAQFSTETYLTTNPDVREAGLEPLYHFVTFGRSELRSGFGSRKPSETHATPSQPSAEDHEAASTDASPRTAPQHGRTQVRQEQTNTSSETNSLYETWAEDVRGSFDVGFYRESYPDVEALGVDLVFHYVSDGWKEGRDPTRDFATNSYLEDHEDIRRSGVCPFWHYVVVGASEGRTTRSRSRETAESVPETPPPNASFSVYELEVVRPHFDADYYAARYPDIVQSDVDPLSHYMAIGWREGRDPKSSFSTKYYLSANEDIRTAGINPFFHYIAAGQFEGRLPRIPGGFRTEILKTHRSHEEQSVGWLRQGNAIALSTDRLKSAVARYVDAASRGVVLSFSHDDYRGNVGGIQGCIAREVSEAERIGFAYIHVSPWQALPILSDEDAECFPVNVSVNGKDVGTCVAEDLAAVLAGHRASGPEVSWNAVIHSALGHSPSAVSRIVSAISPARTLFWLHDFSALCGSYTLLRNGIRFCGAPPMGSDACRVCSAGPTREAHVTAMLEMLSTCKAELVAPSKAAADIALAAGVLGDRQITVLPHGHVVFDSKVVSPKAKKQHDKRPRRRTRIAFLGHPAVHKGFEIFRDVVDRYRTDSRYEFLLLGASNVDDLGVRHASVRVTPDDLEAMTRTIREMSVDYVLVWSIWPETFSLVTFEALAGGAHIITNIDSGNVAAAVERTGSGFVLSDENALYELLAGPRLVANDVGHASIARQLGHVEYGKFSFTLLNTPEQPKQASTQKQDTRPQTHRKRHERR